jgi:hypothetical protein
VGSEFEQFIRLVEAHGLKQHFEEFAKTNDQLVASGNQFAILIEGAAKEKGYVEAYKRGVALCYQVRCSIVHAGSYSVVFDRSKGADDALAAQMSELEKAVIEFLGIQTA